MDYFQYFLVRIMALIAHTSFKPYYKWITFNILKNNAVVSSPIEF